MFSNAITVALVALPFVAQSVRAGDCLRSYTVSEGDICDSISAANNVSTYQLATINEGYIDASCSNLDPGATICLGYENEDCTSTHVVKAGDLCESIAAEYSIDVGTLYNNNPNILDDCSNIYIGEVLAVCSEVIVPPSGTSLVATAIPPTATAAASVSQVAFVPSSTQAAVVTSSVPAAVVPSSSQVVVVPSSTPAAIVPSSTQDAVVPSSTPTDVDDSDEDDEDDESLPYCDEL